MRAKELSFKMPNRKDPEREKHYLRMRRKMENMDVKKIIFNAPSNIHDDFKALCARNGLKMSQVLLSMLYSYLKKEGEEKNKE